MVQWQSDPSQCTLCDTHEGRRPQASTGGEQEGQTKAPELFMLISPAPSAGVAVMPKSPVR